ncbi:MAG: hypothetical protein JOZ39_11300, partial [Chloroflexi bacterium]|nr:hypothetical protein [Chloroflexota bacterium]
VASPDGRYVLVTHASSPVLSVIDTAADREIERVSLQDQTVSAQRVRWSPDGRHVVVTSMDEPLVTVFTQDLRQQATFSVADGPMGVAFALDGHTALVANHNAGQVTVIDLDARARKAELPAGKGVETLAFY